MVPSEHRGWRILAAMQSLGGKTTVLAIKRELKGGSRRSIERWFWPTMLALKRAGYTEWMVVQEPGKFRRIEIGLSQRGIDALERRKGNESQAESSLF